MRFVEHQLSTWKQPQPGQLILRCPGIKPARSQLAVFETIRCVAQVRQLETKLKELDEERAELAQYQQIDKQRRSLEYAIYDKEISDVRAKLEQVMSIGPVLVACCNQMQLFVLNSGYIRLGSRFSPFMQRCIAICVSSCLAISGKLCAEGLSASCL